MSKSLEIAQRVATWLGENGLCQVFGGIVYDGKSEQNKKFRGVDFCVPRYLDGTVKVFHEFFIVVNTTSHGSKCFKSEENLMLWLKEIFNK